MLEPLTYQDLLEAQQKAKVAQRQFRLMLNNAGYHEVNARFLDMEVIVTIAVHPDHLSACEKTLPDWEAFINWCDSQKPEAYFVVDGSF